MSKEDVMAPAKRKASVELKATGSKLTKVEDLPVEYRGIPDDELATKCVNTIRVTAPCLPLAANSGHPGAPMGCAVMAHALWGELMKFSPTNPHWWNRDRFVLSNGHGCSLQYLMLYLTGYDMTLDDLKKFRSWESKTPGHPEVHMTKGIEVTTGPLGQGVASAVGLAIAQSSLAAHFNRPGYELFDNFTYCILGDGCMQEGVASEACSLAGHLGLGKLICLYDDNKITIDGNTNVSFTEDVKGRFEAYGWHVQWVENGNEDLAGVLAAVRKAQEVSDKPSLIGVRTTIAYGSNIQGTAKSHGSPLKEDDIKQLRAKCGFSDDIWDVPKEALEYYRSAGAEGTKKCEAWTALFEEYKKQFPTEAAELERRFKGELPENWMDALPKFTPECKPEATRSLSEKVLNAVAAVTPELIGGSADLTESNKTDIKGETDFQTDNRIGRYLRFGVREHGMVAICNGLFAYGGFRPYCATFLNFFTYAWGACRLSALSNFGIGMIATHDSIDLGEDGPTHQPIETAALVRATPNMLFMRPCDGNETSGTYAAWLKNHGRPTVMALSRSNLPHLPGTSIEGTLKGAYVLEDFAADNSEGKKICLAGSGTETQHALGAAKILREKGYNVRVVSMPCWELFDEQGEEYKRSVIPHKRDAVCAYIEAYSTYGFSRFFEEEASVGMRRFGSSAPAKELMKQFGFTPENFAKTVEDWIKEHRP